MTTQSDPGSYTVADDPWDDFQSTKVPLRTPKGPVTLTFINGDQVLVDSGYQLTEYGGGSADLSGRDEAFTWQGAEIVGYATLFLDQGWMPRTTAGYGSPSFSARKRNVTALMTNRILAYWSELVRRYVAEHPLIPAHAAMRRAVRELEGQEKKIHEAEQELSRMRAERAATRRRVRTAFIAESTASEPDVTCWPLPYHRETLNGYVLELRNDADLNAKITDIQLSRRTYTS